MSKKKFGLKRQSVVALLISVTIALVLFEGLLYISVKVLDHQLDKSAYIKQKALDYMDLFEEYVAKKNISTGDRDDIDAWVNAKESPIAILYISRDGNALYDSLQSYTMNYNIVAEQETDSMENGAAGNESTESKIYAGEEYSSNEWFIQRDIEFSDGSATVSLYAYFDQLIYDVAFIVAAIISVIVLCVCFLCFASKKINAILKLENDVKIIETGGLDYTISAKGCDEIAALAHSLDQMRLALAQNMKKESDEVKANYDLVVAVSHDIRTPLTALALYLDLIITKKYADENQMNTYLEKSRRKVTQIKQMTDNLFERFYLEKEPVFEETKSVKSIFEDPISNFIGFLAENGFDVQDSIQWSSAKAVASSYYINRIFDNLGTNILKYAKSDSPIIITADTCGKHFIITVKNELKDIEETVESTGVGVDSIHMMMGKMNGNLNVIKTDTHYISTLAFECYDE